MNIDTDTIAAIATPIGKGGIGIIRISGPKARDILDRIFRPRGGQRTLIPRYMVFGDIFEPRQTIDMTVHTEDALAGEEESEDKSLDQALAVYMPGPHSYTGEDICELQCHGSPRLLQEILVLVLKSGARLATPGEFTLRAFLNGRLDLAQAEAVCDLIEAKTPLAAAMAERQLSGVLSQKVVAIEEGLRHILALITVGVDFPDDVDAPENRELANLLGIEAERIDALLDNAELGLTYREGVRTALLGAVNAGKSSLMNALLSRERAIVTSQPGTTRDMIEESLDMAGLPICLCDTAGLRPGNAADEAEKQGIARAYTAAQQAQLLLLVIDAKEPPNQQSRELLESTQERKRIIILNKKDVAPSAVLNAHLAEINGAAPVCMISAKTQEGLAELKESIVKLCGASLDAEAASPLLNNLRHIQALQRAKAHLTAAASALDEELPVDFAGIDIENACFALGEITGTVISEEVLKEIFSRFCLGK